MKSSTKFASYNSHPAVIDKIRKVPLILSIALTSTVSCWLVWRARLWLFKLLQNINLLCGSITILIVAYFIWLAIEAHNAPQMPPGQRD